ncbi:unannotated protein [freshwater metagenome]|uniref:Unannotated protein n=1 Tax=freshwater metagenome TaxID=449393 RepID=A0A6J6SJ68_9ZZZZ
MLDPASNPVIGSLTVIKQTSAISGAVKKAGKKFTATASVVRQIGLPGAGKVTAKLGSKTIGTKSLNDAGTAKFALPRSAAGKKVTLVYGGDTVTSGSKVKLPVR